MKQKQACVIPDCDEAASAYYPTEGWLCAHHAKLVDVINNNLTFDASLPGLTIKREQEDRYAILQDGQVLSYHATIRELEDQLGELWLARNKVNLKMKIN